MAAVVFQENDRRYRTCCCFKPTIPVVLVCLKDLLCILVLIILIAYVRSAEAATEDYGLNILPICGSIYCALAAVAVILAFAAVATLNHSLLLPNVILQTCRIVFCFVLGVFYFIRLLPEFAATYQKFDALAVIQLILVPAILVLGWITYSCWELSIFIVAYKFIHDKRASKSAIQPASSPPRIAFLDGYDSAAAAVHKKLAPQENNDKTNEMMDAPPPYSTMQ